MKEFQNIVKKIGSVVVKDKNILFLQGPMGPFFAKFSNFLQKEHNSNTYQVIYNGGDEYYAKEGTIFLGNNETIIFSTIEFLSRKGIDTIFLLGDEREIHHAIIKWIQKNKPSLNIFVFEEGYFRPNYITIEKGGVNYNSELDLSYKAINELSLEKLKSEYIEPISVGKPYKYMALQATIYYFFTMLKNNKYKKYSHHRDNSIFKEGYYGIVNFIKLKYHKLYEKEHTIYITTIISKEYIFFPLQVESDFQIKKHSPFNSIEETIEEFFRLYKNYNLTDNIVIKHHPMDRGKNDYNKAIKRLMKKYNIEEKKILYIYDVDLPTCLKHAKKCITVNSTVGISALIHEVPVYLMGNANYNIKDITNTEKEFFTSVKPPNMNLFKKFKFNLINKTQINGSFYKEI